MGRSDWSQYEGSISDYLREEFDKKFIEIKKENLFYPFSVNIILKDLFESGVSPLDALDVLDEIKPHLYRGITSQKIIQLIYQAFNKLGINNEFFKDTYLQPIIIEFQNSSSVLDYDAIRHYLEGKLENFVYKPKTFQEITDELHRIVISMRSKHLKIDVIDKMLPSVVRNVIGLNPFSSNSLNDDYKTTIKLRTMISKAWKVLPIDEKPEILISLFESIFRIVLLNYNYLPGQTINDTIDQVTKLTTDLSHREYCSLDDRYVYLLTKSSKQIIELVDENFQDSSLALNNWEDNINELYELVESLMEQGTVVWLILIDQTGNELYSKFSDSTNTKHKSLLGMALSGVQSLVNELTDNSIKEIEQDEGSILIERRKLFSIIAMVNPVTPIIRQKLIELADFIFKKLQNDIQNFSGNVNPFYDALDYYLNTEFAEEFSGMSE